MISKEELKIDNSVYGPGTRLECLRLIQIDKDIDERVKEAQKLYEFVIGKSQEKES